MSQHVESLTHLGLGRTDQDLLVPRVLPGEVIDVQSDGSVRIERPSADRVAAPCTHYKSCGGCSMQHASLEFVAAWKRSIVERALAAHGLVASVGEARTSPPESRRRARFSGRRTKKGALVGFHAKASEQIVEVPNCLLVTQSLRDALAVLQRITILSASRKAEMAFTVTESETGLDVHIETGQPLTPPLRADLARVAQQSRLARLAWNDEVVVTMDMPSQRFGTARVVPPPGAFLQATLHGEENLVAAVERICAGADRIADLFSGCGTFTFPLAGKSQVDAFEGSAEMIDALDAGRRKATGLKQISATTRDLFRRPLEVDELTYDAVVIDPPRAGAVAQVERLSASTVPVIAMVSCNPVTFARDAATLVRAGYEMSEVEVVDQFRWSSHVEMVAGFTRP